MEEDLKVLPVNKFSYTVCTVRQAASPYCSGPSSCHPGTQAPHSPTYPITRLEWGQILDRDPSARGVILDWSAQADPQGIRDLGRKPGELIGEEGGDPREAEQRWEGLWERRAGQSRLPGCADHQMSIKKSRYKIMCK